MESITHSSAHLFNGSRSTTISGGRFSNSARDHNWNNSVTNIYMGTQTNPNYESALWSSWPFDSSTGSSNQLAPSADLGGGRPASLSNPGMGLHFGPRDDDTLNTTGAERMLTRRMQTDLGNESVWRSLLSYLGLSTSSLSIQQSCVSEERESPIARYQRHLLVKRHGFPLWSPQPHLRLPLSYRERGVSVGDVGVITPQGSFDFLFSICLPRGHPSNPEVLPAGFSPVHLLPTDICELREHDSGSCLSTSSIEKLRGLTFKCHGPEGSILVMPNGAYHEDLLNFQDFKAIVSQNAEEWYRFAIGTCGRDIKNGQLRLVTGCDKTKSWGIATYSDLQGPVTLSLTANGTQPPVEYGWDYEGRVEAKAGPKFEESLNLAGNREYAQNVQNQCTFLRSFTFKLSDDVWKTMPSTLTQDLLDNNNNSDFNHERKVDIKNDNFGTDSDTSTNHPAMVINQMLLSQYPNAKVAISHDNDWCAVIREDETTMPDTHELLGRMQETFSSHIDDDGTVYLTQNHAFETKPHPNPKRPVCVRGISSDGIGNARNEDEILFGSTRGKQSEGPSNTAFSEQGIVSDDEALRFLLVSEVSTPSTLAAIGPSLSSATSPTQTSHVHGEGAVLLNSLDMESHEEVGSDSSDCFGDIYCDGLLTTKPLSADLLPLPDDSVPHSENIQERLRRLDKMDLSESRILLLEKIHEEMWAELPTIGIIKWGDLPWPVFVRTTCPEDLMLHRIVSYLLQVSSGMDVKEALVDSSRLQWAQQRLQILLGHWGQLSLQKKVENSADKTVIHGVNVVLNHLGSLLDFVNTHQINEAHHTDLTTIISQTFLKHVGENLARILTDTSDNSGYKSLLRLEGDAAQKMLNFLQKLLDCSELTSLPKNDILRALLRLAESSKLYPECLTITDLERDDDVLNTERFGEIYKGRSRSQAICLKVIKVNQKRQIKHLLQEALIWRQLSHPNILPFYGIYHPEDTHGRISLVSPWMENGNVTEYLKRHPLADRLLLISDIILGIQFLHQNQVVHGDLKGRNVLVTRSGCCCLADFGLSNLVDKDNLRWTSIQTTGHQGGGTLRWQAPELIDPSSDKSAKASPASDIYSFACVCYEIYTGHVPFHKIARHSMVIKKVVEGSRPPRPADRSLLSDEIWKVIEMCWNQEPQDRPGAKSVIEQLPLAGIVDDRPSGDNYLAPSDFRAAGPENLGVVFDPAVDIILSSILMSTSDK